MVETWTELVMVLRAKIVAQSFTVDWESNAPCVSIKSTATYREKQNALLNTMVLQSQEKVTGSDSRL